MEKKLTELQTSIASVVQQLGMHSNLQKERQAHQGFHCRRNDCREEVAADVLLHQLQRQQGTLCSGADGWDAAMANVFRKPRLSEETTTRGEMCSVEWLHMWIT